MWEKALTNNKTSGVLHHFSELACNTPINTLQIVQVFRFYVAKVYLGVFSAIAIGIALFHRFSGQIVPPKLFLNSLFLGLAAIALLLAYNILKCRTVLLVLYSAFLTIAAWWLHSCCTHVYWLPFVLSAAIFGLGWRCGSALLVFWYSCWAGAHFIGWLPNAPYDYFTFATISIVSILTSVFIDSAWLDLFAKMVNNRNQLEKLARTDELTGLANRRDIVDKIQYENQRSKRSQKPWSLVIADVDFFKRVNDTYGHDCGDFILRQLAHILQQQIRVTDTLARWGGEEFMFLLPDTDRFGALRLAEKIREAVVSHTFVYKNTHLSITLSLGVSTSGGSLGNRIDRMIITADENLYIAKKQGRNQTVS
jgi:diguanylate cyclase (GGDEF)-like protein